MVSVVVMLALPVAAALCCTHTDWPGVMVPGTVV